MENLIELELFKLENNRLQGDLLLNIESIIMRRMPTCSAFTKKKIRNVLNMTIPPSILAPSPTSIPIFSVWIKQFKLKIEWQHFRVCISNLSNTLVNMFASMLIQDSM